MLPINLPQHLRTGAQGAMLALTRVRAIAAPRANDPRFGAYASLVAIALGAAMMVANMARESCAVPVAAAELVAPRLAKVAHAAPKSDPKPEPKAVAASSSPTLLRAAEKMTLRIDTTPTASIPEKPPVKPKHKPHVKKAKKLDSERQLEQGSSHVEKP